MARFRNKYAEFRGMPQQVSEAYVRWVVLPWRAPAYQACLDALKDFDFAAEAAERQQRASAEWVRAEMHEYTEKLRELRAREAALQLAEAEVWVDAIRDNSDISPPAGD